MNTKSTAPSDWDRIKADIFDAFNHLDIVQMQSMHLFDRPQVAHRASDLVKILEDNAKSLNQLLHHPTPEQERLLQDLFFNLKKILEAIRDLKLRPHELKHQQAFIKAKDHIRKSIDQLFL